MPAKPKKVPPAGHQPVVLPEGVSPEEWNHERVHTQNPRIRVFLGCIRLLDDVLESNYAILHCSPERLLDIWRKVREMSEVIRNRIGPLLETPSKIPPLEDARQTAQSSLGLLDHHVLRSIDRFPEEVEPDQLLDIRKLLCISIGQIHSFLQDTFGELMAKDPRSLHDADYFLSKRFPKDIEEAEWLHATLVRLYAYLQKLDHVRAQHLSEPAAQMRREEALPGRSSWRGPKFFLEILVNGLTPKLKEILPMRGVRFYEMELLDRYATELPTRCRIAVELYEAGSGALEAIKAASPEAAASRAERDQGIRDLLASHAALSLRLSNLLTEIERLLQDLVAFVPLWLEAVEKRRALLLRRNLEEKRGASPFLAELEESDEGLGELA